MQANNQSNQQVIIGKSQPLMEVHSLIQRCAPTDANVLILGENGTGKELVARDIHRQSLRAEHVFMSVDLGAISETLFESELFGHKKGAFTGAAQDRVGRLKAADGGTLFLDEIGNLPLHLQAKLLTVLEQRQVIPLGANEAVPFNVRVLSATNLDKKTLKSPERFRQDLLFRLNTVEIALPPLRLRVDDLEVIAQYYLELYAKKYHKPIKHLDKGALQAIKHYAWPGNIRELRHAIERAIILSQGNVLVVHDFQLELISDAQQTDVGQGQEDTGIISENNVATPIANDELNLEVIEKKTIAGALKQYRYNISHTAKALGLTRAALYRRMEKHGL